MPDMASLRLVPTMPADTLMVVPVGTIMTVHLETVTSKYLFVADFLTAPGAHETPTASTTVATRCIDFVVKRKEEANATSTRIVLLPAIPRPRNARNQTIASSMPGNIGIIRHVMDSTLFDYINHLWIYLLSSSRCESVVATIWRWEQF